ncbi:MAG TPA: hypothetical protein VKE69_08120 [Planctomycetota bacterium]|nr:hypothetical protein [Planctomycetota bacterium]
MSRLSLAALAVAFAVPLASAQVDTVMPFARTSDLLIGDSVTSRVLRATDVDGDGLFSSPGELSVFFDPTVAIDPFFGVPYGALGSPFVITFDLQGYAYVVYTATTNVIVRLRDVDGDGNANGPGESTRFADSGFTPVLSGAWLRGAAADPSGALFVSIDDANDLVVRLVDLNGDGDALDPFEQNVVYDDSIAFQNENPYMVDIAWVGFLPGGTLALVNAAVFHKFTVKLDDFDANGVFHDAGEVSLAYASTNGNPAQGTAPWIRTATKHRLFIDNDSDHTIVVATDSDGDLVYDGPGEAKIFAAQSDGPPIGGGTSFDLRDDDALYFAATSPTSRILRLADGNGDGDARDPGESTVAVDFSATAFPLTFATAVTFMPLEPSPLGTGATTSLGAATLAWRAASGLPKVGNLDFALRLSGGPPSSPVGLLYSPDTTSLPLSALIGGLAAPTSILYVDLFSPAAGSLDPFAATNGAGLADPIHVPLPAGLAPFAGATIHVQALAVDFALASPIVLSNAVSIPLL